MYEMVQTFSSSFYDYLLQMKYMGSLYFEGAKVQGYHQMWLAKGHLAKQLAKSSYQETAIETTDILDMIGN